ncbi:MAG: LysE family translocator [Actinomycetota bacterium]|nr:LysE family translocator [Actinomycetota bacterium]
MVIPSRLFEYIVAAMVIILAPGPSVLFIIARAIAWGRKTAVFTVAGNVTGAFTLSVVVAVGLGPLLQASEFAYHAVQFGGGGYLIYLGIDALRHRRIHAADMTNQGDSSPGIWRSIRDGFWVGALNPKGLVFFAAVVPAFIDRDRGSITAQLILLGAIFAILAFFSDGAWGLLAGTARAWLATDASRLEKLRATGGIVMILLGASVIFTAVVSG